VNRLDLGQSSDEGLPQLVEDMTSDGAQSKTKGVLEGAKESLFGSSDDEDERNGEEQEQKSSRSRSSRRSSSSQKSRSGSSSRGR
jgi:hypothetical protein